MIVSYHHVVGHFGFPSPSPPISRTNIRVACPALPCHRLFTKSPDVCIYVCMYVCMQSIQLFTKHHLHGGSWPSPLSTHLHMPACLPSFLPNLTYQNLAWLAGVQSDFLWMRPSLMAPTRHSGFPAPSPPICTRLFITSLQCLSCNVHQTGIL